MIALAVIAPHGDPAFVNESPTHEAMHELGRRHRAVAPDCTVVLTPHNVHVDGAFAVVTAGTVSGALEEPAVSVSRAVDRALAADVCRRFATRGFRPSASATAPTTPSWPSCRSTGAR